MSFILEQSRKFKRDLKKIAHDKKKNELLYEVVDTLLHSQNLPQKYKDHKLTGNYEGCRECHIKPDLLLVYYIEEGVLYLARLGNHAELFDK